MTEPTDTAEPSGASGGSLAWIPVTERFPADNVDVLVRRKTIAGMRTVVAYRCMGNDCWTLNDGDYDDFCDHSVTHWMPLPAPPTTNK